MKLLLNFLLVILGFLLIILRSVAIGLAIGVGAPLLMFIGLILLFTAKLVVFIGLGIIGAILGSIFDGTPDLFGTFALGLMYLIDTLLSLTYSNVLSARGLATFIDFVIMLATSIAVSHNLYRWLQHISG